MRTIQEAKQVTLDLAHVIGLYFGCSFRITVDKEIVKSHKLPEDALYGRMGSPVCGYWVQFQNHILESTSEEPD